MGRGGVSILDWLECLVQPLIWRGSFLDPENGNTSAAQVSLRGLVLQNFLLGITNPKAIILFAAIFPQFIDPGQPAARQFLVLGSIYLLAEFVSTAVYASDYYSRFAA